MVTREIPEEGLEELKKTCKIYLPEKGKVCFSQKELMDFAPYLDAIIPVAGDKINAEFIVSAKKLKIISAYSVGYDNIDIKTASFHRILVTNLPDIVTESTAELTFLIMLAVSRRLIECDNYIRYHNDKNWHPFLFTSHELFDKKLGILGIGRIGKAVARRALAFGMHVYYHDIKPNIDLRIEAEYLSFKELISKVDYLTLHVPYLESTHHLIGENEFQLMKNSAYLVNASRGSIVDQEALIQALEDNQIKGAALEVFETEPQVPEKLTKLPNVVLTPHVGTNTIETNYKMALEAAKKIIQVFRGQIPTNIVNF